MTYAFLTFTFPAAISLTNLRQLGSPAVGPVLAVLPTRAAIFSRVAISSGVRRMARGFGWGILFYLRNLAEGIFSSPATVRIQKTLPSTLRRCPSEAVLFKDRPDVIFWLAWKDNLNSGFVRVLDYLNAVRGIVLVRLFPVLFTGDLNKPVFQAADVGVIVGKLVRLKTDITEIVGLQYFISRFLGQMNAVYKLVNHFVSGQLFIANNLICRLHCFLMSGKPGDFLFQLFNSVLVVKADRGICKAAGVKLPAELFTFPIAIMQPVAGRVMFPVISLFCTGNWETGRAGDKRGNTTGLGREHGIKAFQVSSAVILERLFNIIPVFISYPTGKLISRLGHFLNVTINVLLTALFGRPANAIVGADGKLQINIVFTKIKHGLFSFWGIGGPLAKVAAVFNKIPGCDVPGIKLAHVKAAVAPVERWEDFEKVGIDFLANLPLFANYRVVRVGVKALIMLVCSQHPKSCTLNQPIKLPARSFAHLRTLRRPLLEKLPYTGYDNLNMSPPLLRRYQLSRQLPYASSRQSYMKMLPVNRGQNLVTVQSILLLSLLSPVKLFIKYLLISITESIYFASVFDTNFENSFGKIR